MIGLSISDPFLLKIFLNLFSQKKLFDSNESINNPFVNIIIKCDQNLVILIMNDTIHKFSKPVDINLIFSNINNFLFNLDIQLGDAYYYPIQQKIFHKKNSFNLNNIHATILNKLILYKDLGISKEILYREIWPNDKDISFNKLDSHLTNFKNDIKKFADFDLKFNSSKKIIKLIFN